MSAAGGSHDHGRDLRLAYEATRAILRASDAAEARDIVVALCRDLGAEVVAATDDVGQCLPLDVSLGEGEPLLPATDDADVRVALTTYVVLAVADGKTVVERNLMAERLTENATRDAVTGLWNRRVVGMAVNRTHRGDAIALVDLDHFKRVNDTLGHDAGDAVLRAFASHLVESVGGDNIVGRLGGEEFVLVFPQCPVPDAVAVLDAIQRSWPTVAPQRITFSAGVAPVESAEPGMAGQRALALADQLMYRAKAAGRARIEWDGEWDGVPSDAPPGEETS